MPTTNGQSYDYQTLMRSVSMLFSQMRSNKPYFASLLPILTPAISNKHEWEDDNLKQASTVMAEDSALADSSFAVASVSGLEIGSIIRFTTATGGYRSVMMKITNIVGTTLTVVRPYGGTTDVALVTGDKVILHSTPREENSDGEKGEGAEGTMAYNFTQIFKEKAGISDTTANTRMYAPMDLPISSVTPDVDILKMIVGQTMPPQLARAVVVAMDKLNRQINQASLFGAAVQRSGAEKGSMGGIFNLIGQSIGVSGDLSKDALNDAFEAIYSKGGDSNKYAIVTGTAQARKLSALKTEANQTIVMKTEDNLNVGDFAQRFTADFVTGKGHALQAQVVTDTNLPNDMLAIVDLQRIGLVPMGDRYLKIRNATGNGQDGVSINMTSEMSLELRNRDDAHCLLTGLSY